MGPRRLLTTVVALGGGAFLFGAGPLRLETHLRQPTEPVATFVDGPTSTTAVEQDNGVRLLPGGTGLVCLLAGAWNIRSAVKRPREALVAAPARPRSGPSRVPDPAAASRSGSAAADRPAGQDARAPKAPVAAGPIPPSRPDARSGPGGAFLL
ncbi:hypothetical protein ABZ612_13170 [Streptomyces avermitilis]|uniref:hypothetical protein n=1 Tax=Streptomyces avermitilis TaxID=33903 RepID=UPI0033D29341